MKKTDIENLYRANQHKFSEKPSKETWHRLENRLDDHFGRRKNRRLNRQHPLAMAAAVLVVVVMVGVISLLADKKQVSAGFDQRAFIKFEDIQTDNAESNKEVIEFTRRHQERLTKPIAEGDDGKKILIAR